MIYEKYTIEVKYLNEVGYYILVYSKMLMFKSMVSYITNDGSFEISWLSTETVINNGMFDNKTEAIKQATNYCKLLKDSGESCNIFVE